MGDVLSETLPSRAEIEAALARILEWPGLARSPQLARFLNYIVLAKLTGNEAGIKAYSIAVDVFGRPQSFDPQSDPIVRVQARRLRAALEEYYAGDGAGETVRFYLPVGRYIPEFHGPEQDSAPPAGESVPPAPTTAPSAQTPQKPILAQIDDIVLIVLLVAVALGIALVLTQVLAPRPVRLAVPQPPRVAIAEFTSVAAGDQPAVSVAGLAVELVTDIDLFPYIEAVYLPQLDGREPPADTTPFELTGIARSEGSDVQITASLKRADSDAAVWSMTQTVPMAEVGDSLDRLSQAFADQLGALRGPLHADALGWLETNTELAGNETEYLCGLLFTLYRDYGSGEVEERARSCVAGLLRSQPQSAAALAINGSLLLDRTLQMQPPGRPDPEPVAEAERQIVAALRLAPTSSPVWREWAFYLERVGRFGEAEAAFASALQLNPANLDALAGNGRLLSLRGASERGESFAEEALRRSISPPYWYHAAAAVNALRKGDNAVALAQSEALTAGDAELGSVIATVASYRMGSADGLNRSIAQLLEVTRFRRFGILPVLRQRLGDVDLRTQIGQELAAAGIDQAALNGAY